MEIMAMVIMAHMDQGTTAINKPTQPTIQAIKAAMYSSMCQGPNRFTSITTTGMINSMDMIQFLGRITTILLSTLPSSMLLQLIQMELVH